MKKKPEPQKQKVLSVEYHNLNGDRKRAVIEVRRLPSGPMMLADGHSQCRWPSEIWDWFVDRAREAELI